MGDDEGMRRCVLDCSASSLAFLGLHRLARLISPTIGNQEGGLTNPMKFVGQVLQQNTNKEEHQQFEYIALNDKKHRKWCPLESRKAYLLCICGVQSLDGKTDHAIYVLSKIGFLIQILRGLAVCGILGSGEQTRIESCIIRIPESMVESQQCSPN
jgi:hypothetical protein